MSRDKSKEVESSTLVRLIEMVAPGLIVAVFSTMLSSYILFKIMDYRLTTLETSFKSYTEKADQVPLNKQRLDRLESDVIELKRRISAACPRESRD